MVSPVVSTRSGDRLAVDHIGLLVPSGDRFIEESCLKLAATCHTVRCGAMRVG